MTTLVLLIKLEAMGFLTVFQQLLFISISHGLRFIVYFMTLLTVAFVLLDDLHAKL